MNDIKNFYQSFGKAIGTTDTVNACDCCGKQNLKKTVVFEFDEDGYKDEGTPYAYGYRFLGSQCALNIHRYAYASTKQQNKIKNTKIDTDFLKPATVTVKNPYSEMTMTLTFNTDFFCYLNGEMKNFYFIKQVFENFRVSGEVERFCKYFEKQYLQPLF